MFQELHKIMSEDVDITFSVKKKGQELEITACMRPNTSDKARQLMGDVKPIFIAGNPATLDDDLVNTIASPLTIAGKLITNIMEVEAQLKAIAEKNDDVLQAAENAVNNNKAQEVLKKVIEDPRKEQKASQETKEKAQQAIKEAAAKYGKTQSEAPSNTELAPKEHGAELPETKIPENFIGGHGTAENWPATTTNVTTQHSLNATELLTNEEVAKATKPTKKEASKTAKAAKEELKQRVNGHITYAASLFKEGKYNEALAEYEKALALEPSNKYIPTDIEKCKSWIRAKEAMEKQESVTPATEENPFEESEDNQLANDDYVPDEDDINFDFLN